MRDRDDGAAGREALERTLNLLFRFGIERGRSFIQKKDGRVLEQCARDGEALLLATGEQTTLIANLRFVTLGLGYDKIVRKRSVGGGIDFIARSVESPKLDVVENGVVKQKRVLRDEADLFAQRFLRERPQVVAVNSHDPESRIVEAQHE